MTHEEGQALNLVLTLGGLLVVWVVLVIDILTGGK
jgi:hypothetical protein